MQRNEVKTIHNSLKMIKYYFKSTAAYRKAVKNYIHDELNFKEIAKRAGNRLLKRLGICFGIIYVAGR